MIARLWQRFAVPLIVAIYTQLLFVLLLAYHTALVFAAAALTDLWFRIFRNADEAWQLRTLWLVVLPVVITRLAWEVWSGLVGLVTNRFDAIDEPEVGALQTRETAPALHALIHRVALETKSPAPDELFISPYPDCYALEDRRFGLSTQCRRTLVLGLPHLAVLNRGELKVILAHEVAHFRGGDTRFGVFLFRFLETLRGANNGSDVTRTKWIDPVYWLRHLYFAILLNAAAPIWKYQELRADATSAKSYGGELTARTLLREWLLAQQFHLTCAELSSEASPSESDQVVDASNPYFEFSRRFRNFNSHAEEYALRRLAAEEKSSLFDCHPTMLTRVEAARTFGGKELLDEEPAHSLLPDFEVLVNRFAAELQLVGGFPP